MILRWLGLGASLLLLISCHGSRQVADSESVVVTVIDATGQSGCRVLLQQKQGDDLLGVRWPDEFVPRVGQQLAIRYEAATRSVFACTAKAIPVVVTQYEMLDSGVPPGTGGIKPGKALCAVTADPYKIPWMVQIMEQIDPHRVTRYSFQGAQAYFFESASGNRLYTCRGQEICQESAETADCVARPDLSDRFVILVRNH